MDAIANFYFSIFMIIAGLCGIGVLAARHPITGAVNLIGVMLSLAGIYGLLAGPFLGIVQILVYAGAIMMLVVFVIMVLNSARERRRTPSGPFVLPALVLPVALVVCVVLVLNTAREARGLALPADGAAGNPPAVGTIDVLAKELFAFGGNDAWFILFELVGVVLLVALTGAVLLAKRRIGSVGETARPAETAEGGHA